MKRYRVWITGYTLVCAENETQAKERAMEDTGYEADDVEELDESDEEYKDCGEFYGYED